MAPRFDHDAAVAEMVRLVNDAAYRQKLGAEARAYAQEEFTWPAVTEKYLAIYQS